MCSVRLASGKKVLGRQRYALGRRAAVRDPDDAFRPAPLQQLGGGGVQGGHGERAQIVPVSEAQQPGRFGAGG